MPGGRALGSVLALKSEGPFKKQRKHRAERLRRRFSHSENTILKFKPLLFLAVLLLASQTFADVSIEIRSKDTAPGDRKPLVSVLAIPGHAFKTQLHLAGRDVQLSGTIESRADAKYLVHVTFADQNDQGTTSLSPSVTPPHRACRFSGKC